MEHIDIGKLNIEAAFFFLNQDDRVELLDDDNEQSFSSCIRTKETL